MTDEMVIVDYNAEQLALIRDYVAKDLNDTEFSFYLNFCKARGLNPLLREIYAIKRRDKKSGESKLTIQTSIDGFRSLAESTGEYEGQTKPEWTDGTVGPDGQVVWVDAWTSAAAPAAARIGVYRRGFREAVYGVARFAAYSTGEFMWTKMPDNQISKCAEAQAFRKCFPRKFGHIYINEEMDQADRQAPLPGETKAKVNELATRAQRAWKDRAPSTPLRQETLQLHPGSVVIGGSTKWKDYKIADAPMEVVSWLAENSVTASVKQAAQSYIQIQLDDEADKLEKQENQPPGTGEVEDFDKETGEVIL